VQKSDLLTKAEIRDKLRKRADLQKNGGVKKELRVGGKRKKSESESESDKSKKSSSVSLGSSYNLEKSEKSSSNSGSGSDSESDSDEKKTKAPKRVSARDMTKKARANRVR